MSMGIGIAAVVGGEISSSAPVSALTRDFLAWVVSRPRTYADAMDVWRSTCPRLTIWEDALIDGLVRVAAGPVDQAAVTLTPLGLAALGSDAAPDACGLCRASGGDDVAVSGEEQPAAGR